MAEHGHRSGVVALLGRPNAGKSTLLNRILGEKLAIVTAKPQTTRSRLVGIWSSAGAQVAFVDTPGFHEGGRPLNRALNALVDRVLDDCDLALLLVDPAAGVDAGHVARLARLREHGTPALAVATRCDDPARRGVPWPPEALAGLPSVRTSGVTGEGVEALLAEVVERLPEGPSLYPEDDLTDRPLRFLVAELVREAAFERLEQEVPYGVAVAIRSFDESRPDLVHIRADLLVERASHKGIVLGKGGATIKAIGSAARREIEALLGRKVFLELWVKCEPGWSKRPGRLAALGYD